MTSPQNPMPPEPNQQPQDGSTAQQPPAPQQYSPAPGAAPQAGAVPPGAVPPGAVPPGAAPQQPGYGPDYPPQYQQPYAQQYPAPAAPAAPGGNGLGIAAIILAILVWPVGFILGIVAAVKPRTRTLGIVAIAISLIVGVLSVVGLVAAFRTANDTLTSSKTPVAADTTGATASTPPAAAGIDPACVQVETLMTTSSQDLQSHMDDPNGLAKALGDIIDKLKAAKAQANDPQVAAGLGAIIDDYTELSDDLTNSKVPDSGFLQKLTQDATNLTVACS